MPTTNVAASDYLENKVLDFVLRNQAFTSPSNVYVGLFTAFAEGGTQTEVSGGSYARTAVTFDAPSGGSIVNSAAVDFPQATAGWGTVTHIGLFDASSAGNLLAYGELASSITVNSGQDFSLSQGDIDMSFGGDMSDYLVDEMLDHVFRNAAYTPPATVYAGLLTAYTDDDTFTEVSGGSYARKSITFDAASGGATANSADAKFNTATGSWGTVSHVGLFDASSSGNLLFRSAVDSSAAVPSGETARFKAGELDVTLT